MKPIDWSNFRKRGTTAGFSLIEVLVCTAIISVMFVSLYGGIASGFALVNSARENLRANQIILEKLETIRLYNWNQITTNGFVAPTFTAQFFPSVVTNKTSTDGSSQTLTEENGGVTYYGTLIITNAPFNNSYSTNMRRVIVSLKWTNGASKKMREMETLVSEFGMQNYVY